MKRVVLACQPKLTIMLFLIVAPMLTAASIEVCAQANQLSLADILIALRSRKVTLTDRNKILTDAINNRGTTFTLTPEIEKELTDTSADKFLLDSIRKRPQIAKVSAVLPPPGERRPKVEPARTETVAAPVPDYAFYEKRERESLAQNDLDAALVDFTKAIELDGSTVAVRMARGDLYAAKKSYVLAIADFTKVIELDPKNAVAYARRAELNEKQGDAALALDDYKKAYALDPTIESAKQAVERFNAEQAKLTEKPVPVVSPVVAPDFVDLGQINETRAVKMEKPVYPANAARARIGGEVAVDIELDTNGNVTKVKAVSGSPFLRHSCEEAARRSKFKPATFGDKAVKAKARIVYSFATMH